MKAIIFGVGGQDGSHLADLLIEKDYEVIGVLRRSSLDNSERVSHLSDNPRFKLVDGDITDVSSIVNLLRQNLDVDEIYNLAAQSHVGVSFKQPGVTWDITAKGCLNILQSIVDLNIGDSVRFYQASSSEMFGKSYDTMAPYKYGASGGYVSRKHQSENTKFLPQSPYAIAKCAAHYMVRLYREGYGLHASAGILFNHEGPRRGDTFVTRKITKWLGEFYNWFAELEADPELNWNALTFSNKTDAIIHSPSGETFPKLRLGNLDAYRDWGYAGDYVEAMWMMLQKETPDDYVVCTGETHTIREFLTHAFNNINITDWESFIIVDPEFYRPAEVDYLRGDNSKALHELGWQPKHSFEDLVKLMVEHDIQQAGSPRDLMLE